MFSLRKSGEFVRHNKRAVDRDLVSGERSLLKLLEGSSEGTNRSIEDTNLGCGLGLHNQGLPDAITENYRFLFCRRYA